MTEKTCPKCKRVLPASQFYKNKSTKDGLSAHCKECHNKDTNARKAKQRSATKEVKTVTPPAPTLNLADISLETLKEELRRRGYSGELRYNKVITI